MVESVRKLGRNEGTHSDLSIISNEMDNSCLIYLTCSRSPIESQTRSTPLTFFSQTEKANEEYKCGNGNQDPTDLNEKQIRIGNVSDNRAGILNQITHLRDGLQIGNTVIDRYNFIRVVLTYFDIGGIMVMVR